jgi:hypothetical protein
MKIYPAWSNFFNDFFNRDWLDWNDPNFSDTNTTLPSVNIKREKKNYEVEMAARVFRKRISGSTMANDVLTISSEKKVERMRLRRDSNLQGESLATSLSAVHLHCRILSTARRYLPLMKMAF